VRGRPAAPEDPTLAMETHAATAPVKPRLRGRLHQIAFFVVVPAGVALVVAAPTTRSRVATLVYALSLVGLYGTSAAYHRIPWSPRVRPWMKRLDHSMIFLLIAGTYTPFALLVLEPPWSWAILGLVWAGAITGIVLKWIRIEGFVVVGATLYITLGWLAVVTMPQILRGLEGWTAALLLVGGILYTTGAIVLAGKRPDPAPSTFGYHEIFHSFVVGGSACHYAVVLLVVLSIRSTLGG
jgi:hemolysin III